MFSAVLAGGQDQEDAGPLLRANGRTGGRIQAAAASEKALLSSRSLGQRLPLPNQKGLSWQNRKLSGIGLSGRGRASARPWRCGDRIDTKAMELAIGFRPGISTSA